MQTTTISTTPIDRTELPSMLATLCYYESRFGPYHPHTLRRMAHVADAYWQAGELEHARPLLERVIKDVGRCLSRDHELRLKAIASLRDLFVAQDDYERAAAAQRELLECQIQRLGSDHSETFATRARLATMLLERVTGNTSRARPVH
jgi:hypothetical protein